MGDIMWKDTIKKNKITYLTVNDDFRQKVLDALVDLTDDLARTPECIKNAKEESHELREYISPEFMALDAILEVSNRRMKNEIDRISQDEAEARLDL